MGKVWFVTGSSRGLGRAIVEAALAAGDSVIATARDATQMENLAKYYGPDRVLTAGLDVTDSDAAPRAIQAGVARFGRIDVVVNNAGYADVTSAEDMDMASFRRQFETNFFGAVHVSRAALPVLRRQGSGHIIQVSSIGGRVASPGLAAYQSAKWALTGFSLVLALEAAPLGVRVSVAEPGGMATDWAGSSMGQLPLSEPYERTVGALTRMRGALEGLSAPPEKHARAIVRLAGEAEPPLRLMLGSQAAELGRRAGERLAAEDEKWHELTVSCD